MIVIQPHLDIPDGAGIEGGFRGFVQPDPQVMFAEAQRKFRALCDKVNGAVQPKHWPAIELIGAEYEAAFQELMDQSPQAAALWEYWFAGGQFAQHCVTLLAIDVSPLCADHLNDTITRLRRWEFAEAAVARAGYRTVPLADWLKSCRSPFAMSTVPQPVFHLLPVLRDLGEEPVLHADLNKLAEALCPAGNKLQPEGGK